MEYIAHHGIKGQKWGIRRYQNPDGSLTPEGLARYGSSLRNKRNRLNVTKTIRQDVANRGREDALRVAAVFGASGALSGGRAAIYAGFSPMALPIGALTGAVGATSGYLAARGNAAINRLSAKHLEKKISEIDTLLGEDKIRKEMEKRIDDEMKKNGKRLNNGGAEEFRKDRYNELVSLEKDAAKEGAGWGNRLSEETGESFTPKKTADYLRKATKNFNEYDPDQIVYQHMGEAYAMLEKGYITKDTYNKLYDAQISEDAWDNAGYLGTSDIVRWHDIDKK